MGILYEGLLRYQFWASVQELLRGMIQKCYFIMCWRWTGVRGDKLIGTYECEDVHTKSLTSLYALGPVAPVSIVCLIHRKNATFNYSKDYLSVSLNFNMNWWVPTGNGELTKSELLSYWPMANCKFLKCFFQIFS